MRLRFIVLLMLVISVSACSKLSQVAVQPVVPSGAYAYVSGVVLRDEITENRLKTSPAGSIEIIEDREDIRPELFQAQIFQADGVTHIIFACDLTYYSGNQRGYGNVTVKRLCYLPPGGSPKLIKAHAYHVAGNPSPGDAWYVFAGAEDNMAMICEQRLYAYHIESGSVVNLMPNSNERICAVTGMEWEIENGDTWILLDVWTGGDQSDPASFTRQRIPFEPHSPPSE